MTLHFDPSNPEELQAARRVIDALLQGLSGAEVDDLTRELALPRPSQTDLIMTELWPRLDGRLRLLLHHAARLSCDQDDYTLADLAEEMGEDVDVLRDLRNQLGQSVRVVEQRVPGAGPIIDQRFDAAGDRWRYWVVPGVREAILDRDVEETYS